MHLHYLLDEREPDPRACDTVFLGGCPVIPVEYQRKFIRSYPAAGILDPYVGIDHILCLSAHRDAHQHAPAGWGEFQCVRQQILKDRLHFQPVDHKDIPYIISYETGIYALLGESIRIAVIY